MLLTTHLLCWQRDEAQLVLTRLTQPVCNERKGRAMRKGKKDEQREERRREEKIVIEGEGEIEMKTMIVQGLEKKRSVYRQGIDAIQNHALDHVITLTKKKIDIVTVTDVDLTV